jgi:undecaprenol kinase
VRFQASALVAVFIILIVLRPPPFWWAIVILACSTVLAAELFNTAVERLADHLHPAIHPEIRIVKDCAAGGVLLSSAGAVGVAIAFLINVVLRA